MQKLLENDGGNDYHRHHSTGKFIDPGSEMALPDACVALPQYIIDRKR